MNLYEILSNYKTSPREEIEKILEILRRSFCGKTFWDALADYFPQTELENTNRP